ncbi:hypothetical protein GCM10007285_19470 [Stappia taiwanensis]|nr:hypothetical protein GCM10007285_19470 [Stappia taiwanensis]
MFCGRDRGDKLRRRRSNRPGNSQAKGPQAKQRSGKQCDRDIGPAGLTEGVTAGRHRAARDPAAGREISQVVGTEGAREHGCVRVAALVSQDA